MRVVLHDHQHIIARLKPLAIAANRLCRGLQGGWTPEMPGRRVRRRFAFMHHAQRVRRSNVGLRQKQNERAPFARMASQLNFSPQQTGQFAADSQPQSRSAVLAAGSRVRLLEGLENNPLLFRWYADASIRNFKSYY